MLKLNLYGTLADKYGKEHKLEVNSFAEAIKAMTTNFADFGRDMGEEVYCLKDKEVLTAETLTIQFKSGDLHLIPKADGDITAAIVTTLIGVTGTAATVIAVVANIVINIALSCIANMLASTPEVNPSDYGDNESPDKNPSFLFQGAQNRSEQGAAIPIVYGEMMVGSHTISSEIRMDNTLTIT